MTLNGSDEMEKFYQNKFYFSYSGLNKLLYSPAMFYNHYVLNQREDSKDAHLVGGSVLHCLLFEQKHMMINLSAYLGNYPVKTQRKLLIIFLEHILDMEIIH